MDAFFKKNGLRRLEQPFHSAMQPVVSHGPFRGLRYLHRAAGSVWFPKVIGSYERELHSVVEELISFDPDLLVDIGAAEGYYAAGFAMRLPSTRIVAADTNPLARNRARHLCRINGLQSRVMVMGSLTATRLDQLLQASKRPAVWCDIEGEEFTLLDPKSCASLSKAWICFERHDARTEWSSDDIVSRFATHEVKKIVQQERSIADFEKHVGQTSLNTTDALLLISELRSNSQGWVVLKPKIQL